MQSTTRQASGVVTSGAVLKCPNLAQILVTGATSCCYRGYIRWIVAVANVGSHIEEVRVQQSPGGAESLLLCARRVSNLEGCQSHRKRRVIHQCFVLADLRNWQNVLCQQMMMRKKSRDENDRELVEALAPFHELMWSSGCPISSAWKRLPSTQETSILVSDLIWGYLDALLLGAITRRGPEGHSSLRCAQLSPSMQAERNVLQPARFIVSEWQAIVAEAPSRDLCRVLKLNLEVLETTDCFPCSSQPHDLRQTVSEARCKCAYRTEVVTRLGSQSSTYTGAWGRRDRCPRTSTLWKAI